MTENSCQNELLHILQQYLSEDEEKRTNSILFIERCRQENAILLLQNLLFLLMQENCPSNLKPLIIVISFNLFSRIESPSYFMSRFQFFNQSCPQLLEQFLSTSIMKFAEHPSLSGHLFSAIAEIVSSDLNEENPILQELFTHMNGIQDQNIIEGFLVAIKDLSPTFVTTPNLYIPILHFICTYIHEPSFSIKIKLSSLQILSKIFPVISIESLDDLNAIMNSIMIGLQIDELKPYSYLCIQKIIKYQILVFRHYSEQLIPVIAIDINASCESLDDKLIQSLCSIISALTIPKDDEELESIRIQFLLNLFPLFFPPLLHIALSNTSSEPTSVEDYNIFILAFNSISRIVECIPEATIPSLLEFIENNIWPTSIESTQVLNAQEASVNFLSLVVTFGDFEIINQLVTTIITKYCSVYSFSFTEEPSFSNYVTFIVLNLFQSQFAKIKDAGLSLCFTLFYRKNLSEIFDHTTFFLSIIPKLSEILDNTSEMIELSELSCGVISCFVLDYIEIDNQTVDLLSLLQKALTHINETNIKFIKELFTLINIIIEKLNFEQLTAVVKDLFDIVAFSFTDENISHNIDEILYMFKTICEKIMSFDKSLNPENLILPFFEGFYELFLSKLDVDNVLSSIAYLGATSTYEHFGPCLESFLQILVENPSDDALLSFSDIIRFFILKTDFDLIQFLPQLTEFAIVKLQENIQTNLPASISLIKLISVFVKKYFEQISGAFQQLHEIFSQIIESIKSIDDSDIQVDLITEVSVFYTNLIEVLKKSSIDISPVMEACYSHALNIYQFVDLDDFSDGDDKGILEKNIQFLIQLSNCDLEKFNQFVQSQSEFCEYLMSFIEIEHIKPIAEHFLISIGLLSADE